MVATSKLIKTLQLSVLICKPSAHNPIFKVSPTVCLIPSPLLSSPLSLLLVLPNRHLFFLHRFFVHLSDPPILPAFLDLLLDALGYVDTKDAHEDEAGDT